LIGVEQERWRMATRTPGRASATPTPGRVSATPPQDPPNAPRRIRKPSTKVLQVQQALGTRTSARTLRSTQPEEELSPPLTDRQPTSHEQGTNTKLEEIVELIASLRETIAQQNRDLTAIKAEQRVLKNQNQQLQQAVESVRTQLETCSANLPPTQTQTWASVASSRLQREANMTISQATGTCTADKDSSRQLAIDVSRVREGIAERIANTEVAKQAIQQGISCTERLAGASIRDFRMWRTDSTSVIKFSVDKGHEAAFRQTVAEWLEPHIPGARLVGPKWHAVKVDWIEVPLAMDIETGKVSRSAMERFGVENKVEVCTMRWLGQPRPSGQHASAVVKVATKEEAEKLLKSNAVTFGGGGIIVTPFEERRTPVACFKCRRFGHRARDCLRPDTCDMCGQEGHLRCETINLHCVNCQGPHRASHRECPEYKREKARIDTRQQHD
jgi:hypothetical protein